MFCSRRQKIRVMNLKIRGCVHTNLFYAWDVVAFVVVLLLFSIDRGRRQPSVGISESHEVNKGKIK